MKRTSALLAVLILGGAATAFADSKIATADVQAELRLADEFYNAERWDDAITIYRSIQREVPSLSVAVLQAARAYEHKHDYDRAIAAYKELLAKDPRNDEALIGLGFTNLEKGDLAAAEDALIKVAQPTREVLYDVAELKLAKKQVEDAAAWYRKAAVLDPAWDKPAVRLALIERTKTAASASNAGSR